MVPMLVVLAALFISVFVLTIKGRKATERARLWGFGLDRQKSS